MKINIVVTDIVNDVTYSRKSVITRVVITLLLYFSTGKQRRHMINIDNNMSLCARKPTIWVSDQVQHKPALEILDLERRGIVLSVQRKQGH